MKDYKKINKIAWNKKTAVHQDSIFYDMPSFKAGKNTLKRIELDLLGNIEQQSVLHLQCHFGQDSISMSRMGARVTGVDLSDKSIELARTLATELNQDVQFVNCDLYSLREHVSDHYDIVFTSYGTIIWLPDLKAWAKTIYESLKPGGRFVMADFHPVIWMYNDDVDDFAFSYFNQGAIVEVEEGTYADRSANLNDQMITWNHSLSETIMALIDAGLVIKDFQEYDYAPYHFIPPLKEVEASKYRLKHTEHLLPLVYSIVAEK